MTNLALVPDTGKTCQTSPGHENVTNFVFRADTDAKRCVMFYANGAWEIQHRANEANAAYVVFTRKPNLLAALSDLERVSGVAANKFKAV